MIAPVDSGFPTALKIIFTGGEPDRCNRGVVDNLTVAIYYRTGNRSNICCTYPSLHGTIVAKNDVSAGATGNKSITERPAKKDILSVITVNSFNTGILVISGGDAVECKRG